MPYQEEMIKLLLSLILGGLIGAEREFHDKAAGLRTIIFICTGATLFTLVSTRFSETGDPARVAAQIVTGVGFLGAGAILRDGARIIGLTGTKEEVAKLAKSYPAFYEPVPKNDATDYSSGQEFHFDYFVGKHVFEKWDLGLSGYYYQQVTDDEQAGAKVGDGFRGRVFAIGPEVGYAFKKATLIFKYQREMAAQYKPEGNNFWLKFIYRF